ncbi:IclR family transcriptional regulator [Actinomadura darangshiensis]|uniref:Glycerol operon regulatory protein n=1 Tax=Actinomadura darangshiensis TaxID=705336 RepID=A0A4V2YRG4_9ACTN|nr:IclR family transcriptional regulator [Actinomadura darangshiensis]TDD66087.1 IclR family transcriptional regulator [Actinomadura darangshiensis]
MEQRSNSSPGGQLERSLDILELLVRSGGPRGLAEIVEAVGGPKTTVHRLLTTLEGRGYVTQDSRTSRYSAGVRCFELGSMWAHQLDLRAVAAPHLSALNRETRETVHLAVYDHGDVVYVDKLESLHPVVAKSYVGRRCPATCVATGRALLAYESREEIASVLGGPLPAYTGKSVTEPLALEEMLEGVRANGYAVNHGSYRDEVGGVAAPVRDHTGRVVASVGLCLPEQRFGPGVFGALRDRTVECAVAVSVAMGGPASPVTAGTVPAVP